MRLTDRSARGRNGSRPSRLQAKAFGGLVALGCLFWVPEAAFAEDGLVLQPPTRVKSVTIRPTLDPAATSQPSPALAFSEPDDSRWARDVVVPAQPRLPTRSAEPKDGQAPLLSMFPALPRSPQKAVAPAETGRTIEMPLSATLRAVPASGGRALGTVPKGTAVRVSACDLGWCAVTTPDLSGYIAERLIDNDPAPKPTKAAAPKPASSKKTVGRKASVAEPATAEAPAAPQKAPVKIFVPSNR